MIVRIMKNDVLGIPKLPFQIVDVRDVATAHINAILKENETDGKRYIVCATPCWMEDIVTILRNKFKPLRYKIVKCTIGTVLFTIYACFDK